MKFNVLTLLVTYATLSFAQSLSSLPQCAQICVGSSFGGCGTFDVKCICSNSNLISNLSCCVAGTCSPADQQATITWAGQLCKSYGISLPTTATCASSVSSGSSPSGTAASSNGTSTATDASASSASGTSTTGNSGSSAGASSTASSKSGTGSATAASTTSKNGASSLFNPAPESVLFTVIALALALL